MPSHPIQFFKATYNASVQATESTTSASQASTISATPVTAEASTTSAIPEERTDTKGRMDSRGTVPQETPMHVHFMSATSDSTPSPPPPSPNDAWSSSASGADPKAT